jgi:hypothetical protein
MFVIVKTHSLEKDDPVWNTRFYSNTYCTMLGVSIASEPQLYVLLTVDTVRIGNSFITILITRSYNYLQVFLTLFKRLHNYNPHKLLYVSN